MVSPDKFIKITRGQQQLPVYTIKRPQEKNFCQKKINKINLLIAKRFLIMRWGIWSQGNWNFKSFCREATKITDDRKLSFRISGCKFVLNSVSFSWVEVNLNDVTANRSQLSDSAEDFPKTFVWKLFWHRISDPSRTLFAKENIYESWGKIIQWQKNLKKDDKNF